MKGAAVDGSPFLNACLNGYFLGMPQKTHDELVSPFAAQAVVAAEHSLERGEVAVYQVRGVGDAHPEMVVPGE